jgi:ribosomal protein S18 acetylase RimI-like enzyme
MADQTTRSKSPDMSSHYTETNAPQSKSNIKIIALPKNCKDKSAWDRVTEKCKDFRLFALGESPEAFSSTLAVEKAFNYDVWASRLSNPRATQLLAIHSPNLEEDLAADFGKIEALLDNEWIARTVLMEIADSEVAKLAADKSPWDSIKQVTAETDRQQSENGQMMLVLNGVYVAPKFRHLGVGSSMVATSIDQGIQMARSRGFTGVHFQVRVHSDNALALRLYERTGFEHGETERLVMGEKEKDSVKTPSREAKILVMHRYVSF